MRILVTDPLFAWNRLDDVPELNAVRTLLDNLPDGKLLQALRARRANGRNDYPMHVLWRSHLLSYILRHPTIESCLAELRRNPDLRGLIGIAEPKDVPSSWAMSRFGKTLGLPEHLALIRGMFDDMVKRLGLVVANLGRDVAGDSTALAARPDKPQDAARCALPQPNGATKEYLDDQNKVVKTFSWFGYKLHVLVDTRHEVILAYDITPATAADSKHIPTLLDMAAAVLPDKRVATLVYDKAADDCDTHTLLYTRKIRPVIQNRAMWRDDPERMLPGHDGDSNVVYDEMGTVYCYDKVSDPPVKRKMAYIGHEAKRGTLKYRCPAMHGGLQCASMQRCNAGKKYGMTVRVPLTIDHRRFPPIPRATVEFNRRYKTRTAVERVNARAKLFWGADDGNVTGAARFHAHLNTVTLVHIMFATSLAGSPRYEGKSLSPVRLSVLAKALQPPAAA